MGEMDDGERGARLRSRGAVRMVGAPWPKGSSANAGRSAVGGPGAAGIFRSLRQDAEIVGGDFAGGLHKPRPRFAGVALLKGVEATT